MLFHPRNGNLEWLVVENERQASVPQPVVSATVPTSLAGLVKRVTCYDASWTSGAESRETAAFVVPIIINFAVPFRIAFDRAPRPEERIGCFTSGLHPGHVDIAYCGPVSCVQIDLSPIGARLFFRRPMSDLATRLVPLEDIEDRGLNELRDRLGAAASRSDRLGMAVAFLQQRLLGPVVDRDTAVIWSAIQRSRGNLRIDRLTETLGWSRKRLAAHSRDAFGLTPKKLARIARFRHVVQLANAQPSRPDWAGIAAECGYVDQAHLVREFASFAGRSPEAWRHADRDAAKQIHNQGGGDQG